MEWIVLYLLFTSILSIWLMFCIGIYLSSRLAGVTERKDAAVQCDGEETISERESEDNFPDILCIKQVTKDKGACFSLIKVPDNLKFKGYTIMDVKCRAEVGGEHERENVLCVNCNCEDHVSNICNSDCEHVGLRIGEDTVILRQTRDLNVESGHNNRINEGESVAEDKTDTVEDEGDEHYEDIDEDPNSEDDTSITSITVYEDYMSSISGISISSISLSSSEIDVSDHNSSGDDNDVSSKHDTANGGSRVTME